MDSDPPDVPAFRRSPAGLALLVALTAAGFYLLTEHTAHVFGVLPFLFLLACPLMHVFMHRGHGHGGHHHGQHRSSDDEQRRQ
jgi:hypothetical protein